MKRTLIIVAVAAAALSATVLNAASYQDFDEITQEMSFLTGPLTYQGSFNLLTGDAGDFGDFAGYNPSSEQIDSAHLQFAISTLFGEESGILNLDLTPNPNPGFGPQPVIGTYSFFQDLHIDFSDIYGGDLTGAALIDLSQSGLLNYTVTITSGGFSLDTALLTATTSPVPEPSALSLSLVAGALLSVLRRKAAK